MIYCEVLFFVVSPIYGSSYLHHKHEDDSFVYADAPDIFRTLQILPLLKIGHKGPVKIEGCFPTNSADATGATDTAVELRTVSEFEDYLQEVLNRDPMGTAKINVVWEEVVGEGEGEDNNDEDDRESEAGAGSDEDGANEGAGIGQARRHSW